MEMSWAASNSNYAWTECVQRKEEKQYLNDQTAVAHAEKQLFPQIYEI